MQYPINKMKNPSFALTSTIKSIIGRERYDIVHAFTVPSADTDANSEPFVTFHVGEKSEPFL